MRAARSRSCRSVPGGGTAMWRTWKSMSKEGSSAHSGGANRNGGGTTRWPSRGRTFTARSMRRRKRAKSGGLSRRVSCRKDDRRAGSFSIVHISASASLMRRSKRRGRSAITRDAKAGSVSARYGGALELVELGPARQQVEDPLHGDASPLGVAPRTVHDSYGYRLAAGNEGGDAEHVVVPYGAFVLGAEDLQRLSACQLCEDLVGVGAVGSQHVADDVLLPDVEAFIVAGGEEGPLDGREDLGPAVAYGDAGLHGEQARRLGGVVPDVGIALLDVGLVEGERHPCHVPGGACFEGGEDVLAGVSGEGTAVVPGHGN